MRAEGRAAHVARDASSGFANFDSASSSFESATVTPASSESATRAEAASSASSTSASDPPVQTSESGFSTASDIDVEPDGAGAGDAALYEGSSLTAVAASFLLLALGSVFNCSQLCMTVLFKLLKRMLPAGNTLPTYASAKRMVMMSAGVDRRTYDMCGSCGLTMFRDKDDAHDPDHEHRFADLDACPRPSCGARRVDPHTLKKTTTQYTHLGLVSQLKALILQPAFRAATKLFGRTNSAVLEGVQDSFCWNKYLEDNPLFASVLSNLLLAFCTDGVNPFKGGQFSVWPMMWKVRRARGREREREG